MLLLLSTGLIQLKNYLLHNKAKSIMISVFAAVLIGQIFFLNNVHYDTSDIYGYIGIDFLPCIAIVATFFVILSFAQADVLQITPTEANIYFVSPIREHKILIYAFLKSSYLIFILMFAFAQLNLTTIKPFFNLDGPQTLRLFLWEALLFCTNIMFGIFLTIVKKKSTSLFYALLFISIVGSIGVSAIFVLRIYGTNLGNVFNVFNVFFTSHYWTYVPIVGLLIQSSKIVLEVNTINVIYVVLCLLLNLAFILSPYYIKVAMGELAIDAAEKNKKRMQRKRNQQTKGFTIENKAKDSSDIKLSGTWAIISKQWIDYKRSSRLFLSGSIWLIVLIMTIYLGMFKLMEFGVIKDSKTSVEDVSTVTTIFAFVMVGVLMLLSMIVSSNAAKDVMSPQIFLIPDRAYKKLMAVSVMSNFENLVKTGLIFGFQMATKIEFGLAFCISMLYFLSVSTGSFIDLFTYAVFGRLELGMLQTIAGAFIKGFVVLIYVGVYLSLCVLFSPGSFQILSFTALIIVLVAALLIDTAIILLSEGLVEKRD